MKDLDFDELDRAVNSLMGGASKNQAQQTPTESSEKTLDITPTLDENEKPPLDEVEKMAAQAVPVSDSPHSFSSPSNASGSPSISSRRGGRFMDVVHPSSDMKKPPLPSHPISRQGVAVEPRSSVRDASILPPEPKPAPLAEVPKDKPAPPLEEHPQMPELERTAPVNEWPDPLEMANFKDEDEDTGPKKLPPSSPIEEPVMPEVPDKQVGSDATDDASTPLTSPFLPHAKVEKRPLGGAAPVEEPDHAPVLEGANMEEPPTANDPNAQLPALPEDVAPVLPEELRSDLMAIEADSNAWDKPNEKDEESIQKAEPVPVEVKSQPAPAPKPSETSAITNDQKEPSPSTGPTSIPQQYREEPDTGEQESGAIYDTDAYHQPLAHPAQNKSGWMWVVWIVLILLVGAGAGAALYFLGVV